MDVRKSSRGRANLGELLQIIIFVSCKILDLCYYSRYPHESSRPPSIVEEQGDQTLSAFLPSSMMSADEKFKSKDELEDWLKRRGFDDNVADAADALFAKGFNRPSALLGITVEELKSDAGIQIHWLEY